jgi:hypothetical protein
MYQNTESESTMDTGSDKCNLCEKSSQHFCRKCDKPVCNLFCSEEDPASDNPMHRVHKTGDIRWISSGFECPSCGKYFTTATSLSKHVEEQHAQISSLSLISENSNDWMYVACSKCQRKFENESDLHYHEERFHECGETCSLYPCDECGFRGQDIEELKRHKVSHDETGESNIQIEEDSEEEFDIPWAVAVEKRIAQNL